MSAAAEERLLEFGLTAAELREAWPILSTEERLEGLALLRHAEAEELFLGVETVRVDDCGVAGLHRLLAHLSRIRSARAAIVIAGMEGALPSVVGGLVERPVVAVPTSVGYGASFGGIAALLAMLNSCAAGVTVVNIDNGFGAGYAAALINRLPPPS